MSTGPGIRAQLLAMVGRTAALTDPESDDVPMLRERYGSVVEVWRVDGDDR